MTLNSVHQRWPRAEKISPSSIPAGPQFTHASGWWWGVGCLLVILTSTTAWAEPTPVPTDAQPPEGLPDASLIGPSMPHPAAQHASGAIRLRARAMVSELRVRLRDVADLTGNVASTLGATIVATLEPADEQRAIRLESIRQTLDDRGVNWGRLTLGGYTTCQVWRVATPEPQAPLQPTSQVDRSPQPATVQTNLVDEISLSSALTLRTRLTQWIQDWAGVASEELRLTFNERDAETLSRSAWQDRYEFEPVGAGPLGCIPVVIRQYRDGRVIQTDRVTVDVERRVAAVVVTSTVSQGQTLTDQDVQVREAYVTHDTDDLMTDPSRVVGLQAAAVLRPGTLVKAKHLRSPLLVRRGDLVMVRTVTGGLVVKTVARAMKHGSMGDTVEVRNERSREIYSVRVSGVQQAVLLTSENATPKPTSGPGVSLKMENPS